MTGDTLVPRQQRIFLGYDTYSQRPALSIFWPVLNLYRILAHTSENYKDV